MKLAASPVRGPSASCRRPLPIRAAARELSTTLTSLLAVLADVSDGDGFWLRPLAAASVELDFSVRRGTAMKQQAVNAVCRGLLELLAAEPQARGFAARYARARQALRELQELHERAQVDCRNALGACPVNGVTREVCDPPCDFGDFVAERRGITRDESDGLIAVWLATYEPRPRGIIALRASAPTIGRDGCVPEPVGQSAVNVA